MSNVLITLTDAILDFSGSILDFVYKLIGTPEVPDFFTRALAFLLDILANASHLISFIFPNSELWFLYICFIVDIQISVYAWRLISFIINNYHKLKR